MKVEIVELEDLSGNKATIYSVIVNDETLTLFDKFLEETEFQFEEEIDSIFDKIDQIAHFHGARRQYFKENEGKLGDLVCALYDSPNSNLRLYCIRLGSTIIILGGGGHKPKSIRALQEDSKLTEENYLLRQISTLIYEKMKAREIFWKNEMELGGNLTIDANE